MEFMGDRIQNAREKKDLRANEAAYLCDIKPSLWSLYESNNRKPSIDKLRTIAIKLEVSSDYLLGIKKEMD